MAIKLPIRRTAKAVSTTESASAQPSAPPQDLLTIRETMAFARASESSIRRWIRTKELPAYKVGGRVLIDRSDLVKFINPWSSKKAL